MFVPVQTGTITREEITLHTNRHKFLMGPGGERLGRETHGPFGMDRSRSLEAKQASLKVNVYIGWL